MWVKIQCSLHSCLGILSHGQRLLLLSSKYTTTPKGRFFSEGDGKIYQFVKTAIHVNLKLFLHF